MHTVFPRVPCRARAFAAAELGCPTWLAYIGLQPFAVTTIRLAGGAGMFWYSRFVRGSVMLASEVVPGGDNGDGEEFEKTKEVGVW